MKILIKINNNKLSFINRKKLNTEYKNMLNTNVISNDELVFSDEYIKENNKLLVNFFNGLIKTYNISTVSFQNNEVAQLIIPFINKLKNISIVNFESDEVFQYRFVNNITKMPDIKFVSASIIPTYVFELFDKNGITPESRNEILFTSKFMGLNGLNTYSSLFYKNMIYLDFPLTEDDIADFTTFCDINRHLKIINVNEANKNNLEQIINILRKNNHKNIIININANITDIKLVQYLKQNNKKFKNKYKISFKLKYSDNYIRKNALSEVNNNILRMCGLLILSIIIFCFLFIFYDNYKSLLKEAKIEKELSNYIENVDPENQINIIEKHSNKGVVNNYLASLKVLNSDVVGWLKVNNTNIDYAILQTTNNEYYLNYNINKEKDPNGWLFLDYENNPEELDDNNIIYGHNRYVNGVMFGTLNKVLYKNWYTNEENQIIHYDTLYGSYKFRVFSIYIIPVTDDYIYPTYDNKMEFLNKIKSRSIYDFNVELDESTKVLTLSTCQSDTTRLVLHAALIVE